MTQDFYPQLYESSKDLLWRSFHLLGPADGAAGALRDRFGHAGPDRRDEFLALHA